MESQSEPSKSSQSLQALASGPLSSSVSSLSSSSRTLPSNQDFHFFHNFDQFKLPIDQIDNTSHSLLESIGSSAKAWGANKAINFPNKIENIADDEAYDWTVNIIDECLERFDMYTDEFQKIRKKQEETGRVNGADPDTDGFQVVHGKKKKKGDGGLVRDSVGDIVGGKEGGASISSEVKVKKGALAAGTSAKAKVPFHIPTIRRPQEEYNILVNNSNQPFEHVWLQRSEDGQRFVHPLEKLSVMDFVDKDIANIEPINPPSIESTPFKLVEEVKDLKELVAKLRSVNEFAVDLEHNQYRSFQGLTCLMQISTRTEDFIVDTLKLRIHVGPYLREVFKDPTKKKVMHGADRDILWLQRDFGIYLCNLFDTGQASRVLKLERNSLEYLLLHFCGVTANKEYQNADWRLRPLPDEMIRYAREDTHYLLYIYDLMRIKLLSMPKESEHCDAPLGEVYKRSSEVCLQLYEKELLTENSYLHIYGLLGAGFNAEQLAIVAALCEWRDIIARAEDESTGYVLPNKTLLEIAKQMPVTTSKLRRLLKSKHPYVERNLGSVVTIIRHSMQNAIAFEAAAQQLRMGRVINASEEHVAVNEGAKILPPETSTDLTMVNDKTEITDGGMVGPACPQTNGSSIAGIDADKKRFSFEQPIPNGPSTYARESLAISGQSGEINACTVIPPSAKIDTGATVQVLKKPSRGIGALLGNAATKKKFETDKKDKEESKLEQIRSSVNLSFHSFLGTEEQSKPAVKEPNRVPEVSQPEEPPAVVATESTLEDIIMLEDNSNKEESIDGSPEVTGTPGEESSVVPYFETNKEDEAISLSELSTSFEQCFETGNQNRKMVKVKKSKEPSGLQIKPFDYEAGRKQVRFGEDAEEESGSQINSAGKKKSSAVGRLQIEDGSKQFPQARRRQAFPASGNRSATFR
ncbi:protein RRP6-like 2 [Herrania umbratica]|uniref:Protein RRP6-like 2 n=1 Tax=Herrania umbratica TaxID=108875 RepID=A0A6J1A547_9ROSI|nr:protein RRP6-like 2 [Herrania umbratica]